MYWSSLRGHPVTFNNIPVNLSEVNLRSDLTGTQSVTLPTKRPPNPRESSCPTQIRIAIAHVILNEVNLRSDLKGIPQNAAPTHMMADALSSISVIQLSAFLNVACLEVPDGKPQHEGCVKNRVANH